MNNYKYYTNSINVVIRTSLNCNENYTIFEYYNHNLRVWQPINYYCLEGFRQIDNTF